jgi:hypothetical protein
MFTPFAQDVEYEVLLEVAMTSSEYGCSEVYLNIGLVELSVNLMKGVSSPA